MIHSSFRDVLQNVAIRVWDALLESLSVGVGDEDHLAGIDVLNGNGDDLGTRSCTGHLPEIQS